MRVSRILNPLRPQAMLVVIVISLVSLVLLFSRYSAVNNENSVTDVVPQRSTPGPAGNSLTKDTIEAVITDAVVSRLSGLEREMGRLQTKIDGVSSTLKSIKSSTDELSVLQRRATQQLPSGETKPGENIATKLPPLEYDSQLQGLVTNQLEPGQPGRCHFHSQVKYQQDRTIFMLLGGHIDTSSCKKQDVKAQSSWRSEAELCDCVAPPSDAFHLHFLEIGANDGQYLSNTLFFEAQMGWTGVCVEASPAAFKFLDENRPNCHNVHAVIGEEVDGSAVEFFTFTAAHSNSWETGLSCMKGFSQCETADTAEEFARKRNLQVHSEMVPGTTLSKVFQKAGLSLFGLWSIDVEGAEDIVIPTIDMRAARAKYVIYEGSPDEHPVSHQTLVTHGYERFYPPKASRLDTFYRPVQPGVA
jgi:FkbM family methyltransferase